MAIETSVMLRLVFRQPLRQTEGLMASIFELLELDLNPNEARRMLQSAPEAHYPRAEIALTQMNLQQGNVTGAELRPTVESMICGMRPAK